MTDETIDLAKITDLNQLKALAYDRLAGIEQLQSELQVLNSRIRELSTAATNGKARQTAPA